MMCFSQSPGHIMKEHAIQNEIRNALAGNAHIFRANVGSAWTGEAHYLRNGDLLIKNPRPFSSGLPTGFSDLFGFASIEITPEMVGQKVAVFIAGECKTATGRPTHQQQAFLKAVNDNGGAGDVWRSANDALQTIQRAGMKK